MLQTRDGKYTFQLDGTDNAFKVFANSTHPKWMQMYIADDTKLSDCAIPGTHDTGTYALHDSSIVDPFAVTQDYAILSQLYAGIRVLDIRLGLVDGNLDIYHAKYKADISFDTVLRQAFEFLDANPKETVVMLIKREYGDDVADAFWEAIKARDSSLERYWITDSMLTMGDVRNKIVFVNRNRNINDVGIQVEWQNDTTFKSDGEVDFYIQDNYGVNFDYKEIYFDELLKAQLGDPGAYLVLQFRLTCCLKRRFHHQKQRQTLEPMGLRST